MALGAFSTIYTTTMDSGDDRIAVSGLNPLVVVESVDNGCSLAVDCGRADATQGIVRARLIDSTGSAACAVMRADDPGVSTHFKAVMVPMGSSLDATDSDGINIDQVTESFD